MKRRLSFILAVLMLFSLLPVSALAEELEEPAEFAAEELVIDEEAEAEPAIDEEEILSSPERGGVAGEAGDGGVTPEEEPVIEEGSTEELPQSADADSSLEEGAIEEDVPAEAEPEASLSEGGVAGEAGDGGSEPAEEAVTEKEPDKEDAAPASPERGGVIGEIADDGGVIPEEEAEELPPSADADSSLEEGAIEESELAAEKLAEPEILSGEEELIEEQADYFAEPAAQQDNAYFSTIEESVAFLRSNMVDRCSTITFSLLTDSNEPMELSQQIYSLATDHTGNPKEGDYLVYHSQGWNSSYTMEEGENKNQHIIHLTYTFEWITSRAQEEDVNNQVSSILQQINSDEMNDYEKIESIYEYVTSYVDYDYGHINDDEYMLSSTAYAALFDGLALCGGYAVLMYRLLLEAGFDSRIVTGFVGEEAHAWNIVQLDGKYYSLDATWDAGRANYQYLLKGRFGDRSYDTPEDIGEYDISLTDCDISQYITLIEIDDIIYQLSAGRAIVKGYTGDPVDVTIPDSVSGCPVTEIADTAFLNCKTLQSVVLPKTLQKIDDGRYEFNDDTMRYDPYGAFACCSALEKVTIPRDSELTVIGKVAFCGCAELSEFILPDSCETLALSCFEGCASLTSLSIPQGMKIIAQNALTSTGIKSLSLPSGLEYFDNWNSMHELVSIDIEEGNPYFKSEDGILYARWGADDEDYSWQVYFYPEAKSDEIYVVPDFMDSYLSTIAGSYVGGPTEDHYVYRSSPRILDIGTHKVELPLIWEGELRISDDNPYYALIDGALYDKDVTTLICVPSSVTGTLVIPEGVTSIEHSACYRSRISGVVIPGTVKQIGDQAFSHCPNLETIVFPEEVDSWGSSMCSYCKSLKRITLPGNITDLKSVVDICAHLEELTIPESVTQISFYDLYACLQLAEITIPASVKVIEEGTFSALSGLCALKKVYFQGTQEQFDAIAIGKNNDFLLNAALITIDHTHTTTVLQNAKEATCTRDGYSGDEVCTVCEEIVKPGEIVPATGHVPTGSAIAVEPTCTEDGMMAANFCAACGEVLTAQEIIPAKGHTAVTDPGVEATCTEDGLTEGSHCAVCGEVLTAQEVIPATGHTAVTDPGVEATCTEDGLTAGSHCAVCGEVLTAQEVIPAKGHTAVTDPGVEATCTEDGLTEGGHCAVCGEVLTAQEVIPAKGHTAVTDPGVEATCTEDGLTEGSHCSVCGEVLTAQEVIPATGHTAVTDPGVEATCTEDGLTAGSHCAVCGEVLTAQEVIPAKGHTAVTDPGVEATCTEDGLTEGGHCAVCGEVLTAQEVIPAKGHEWDEGVVVKEPTYNEEGIRTYICKNDSEHTRNETIDKLKQPIVKTSITTQPANVTTTNGNTATFTVKAAGTNLLYQWQAVAPGGSWKSITDVPSAKTASLTVPANEEWSGYKFRCRIVGDGGSVYSSVVKLALKTQITAQPAAVKMNYGETVTFTVEAIGTNLLYQWQAIAPGGAWKSIIDDSIPSAKTATLTLPANEDWSGYKFRCRVVGDGGAVFTSVAKLTITTKINTQPTAVTTAYGNTASFTVKAVGTNLQYQWQAIPPGGAWKSIIDDAIPSAKTATLQLPANNDWSGYKFRCRVVGDGGAVFTNVVKLTITTKINTQPANVTAKSGKTATFTVKAVGTNLQYQWQYIAPGGSGWQSCTEATAKAATLKVTATAAKNGYKYRCRVVGDGGSVYTNVVKLTVKS